MHKSPCTYFMCALAVGNIKRCDQFIPNSYIDIILSQCEYLIIMENVFIKIYISTHFVRNRLCTIINCLRNTTHIRRNCSFRCVVQLTTLIKLNLIHLRSLCIRLFSNNLDISKHNNLCRIKYVTQTIMIWISTTY